MGNNDDITGGGDGIETRDGLVAMGKEPLKSGQFVGVVDASRWDGAPADFDDEDGKGGCTAEKSAHATDDAPFVALCVYFNDADVF